MLIRTNEGCNYTYNTSVVVNTKPDVTATTTNSMICEGDSCTVSFSPTTNIPTAQWYLQDTTKAGCYPMGSVLYSSLTQLVKPTRTTKYTIVAPISGAVKIPPA